MTESKDAQAKDVPEGATQVEEELVEKCVDEIETTLDDFSDDNRLATDAVLDLALFTAAVHHAVDSGIEKEEFLAMLDEMFEDSREMGDLESRMSLTRGEA